jgi:hypothetical protein
METSDVFTQWLNAHYPVVQKYAAALYMWRLGAKFVAPKLHDFIQALASKFVTAGFGPDVYERVNTVLSSRTYRCVVFIVDLVFSVKLPKTLAEITEESKPK